MVDLAELERKLQQNPYLKRLIDRSCELSCRKLREELMQTVWPTISQAARACRLSVGWMSRLVQRGDIVAVTVDGRKRIDPASLVGFLLPRESRLLDRVARKFPTATDGARGLLRASGNEK